MNHEQQQHGRAHQPPRRQRAAMKFRGMSRYAEFYYRLIAFAVASANINATRWRNNHA